MTGERAITPHPALSRRSTLTMNIVVLVKQVPDSGSERTLRADDKTVDRGSASLVVNEIDEYAIEEALRLREAHGGEVTVLTMGPDQAAETIRKALSMGPDKAVHVNDPALHGSCAVRTSDVLAKALRTLEWDLVLCGAESTDARVSVIPSMLAERLGVPQLTGARKITVEGTTLVVERQTEEGYELIAAAMPAIASVWDTINEPRYPSFKGIMQAKKKPLTTLSLTDLDVSPESVGLVGSTSEVVDFSLRPAKGEGVRITDEGDGGNKLVDFLAGHKFV
jgi:electron transfer flavoprotein beta subunit